MRIIDKGDEEVIIALTSEEIGVIGLVGVEFTQGAHAPDDEQWSALVPRSREYVMTVFENLVAAKSE